MQDASTARRAAQRGASRRSAPYSREVSIKGSSAPGPTRVLVANLVKGTSPDDVRLTFEPLGRLVYVRHYAMPNLASNAVAFEVAFEKQGDAATACQKYDGVMADGRVLQVTMMAESTAPAGGSSAAPRRARRRANAGAKDAPDVSERFEAEQLPLPVLRRLAQAEAKYLAETERILREKDAPPKPERSASLKDRLGSLPLAQRLAATGPGGPASATQARTSAKAAARRRARQKRAQTGMDVDRT